MSLKNIDPVNLVFLAAAFYILTGLVVAWANRNYQIRQSQSSKATRELVSQDRTIHSGPGCNLPSFNDR